MATREYPNHVSTYNYKRKRISRAAISSDRRDCLVEVVAKPRFGRRERAIGVVGASAHRKRVGAGGSSAANVGALEVAARTDADVLQLGKPREDQLCRSDNTH